MGSSFTVIHGRLVADPEKRTYKKADGTSGTMTLFCVAVDARFGDGCYYWDCTAFGKTGELIVTHFHKGKEILCQGEHVYNEKDKKRFWNLNVDKFDFCGGKETTTTATTNNDTFEQVTADVPF